MKIVVFSELLRAPYDEGIKNWTVHLIDALSAEHELSAITSSGRDDAKHGIRNIDVNRALLSTQLRDAVRHFEPEAIVYVPTACATLFSLARARVLRSYAPGASVALVALQPRRYTAVGAWIIRRLVSPHRGRATPDWVLTQSTRTSNVLRGLGCRTALLPPAVDAARFRPATPTDKAELRMKYGLPASGTIVTQVGHLAGERNLEHFLRFQASRSYDALVVASTSTRQDAEVKRALSAAGTIVIDTYVPNIEDIYRLSDVYLFLAESETAAIDVPLSVLEAMACNLPVVCTSFGGLRDFFPDGHGLFYWDGQAPLGDLVAAAMSTPPTTRALVEPYTWTSVAQTLVRLLQEPTALRLSSQEGVEYPPSPPTGNKGEHRRETEEVA